MILKGNPFYLIFAAIMWLLGMIVRNWRWKIIMDATYAKIQFSDLFANLMINFGLNSVLFRAGDILSPFQLSRKTGVSLSTIYGTILVDRMMDWISFLSLAIVCIFSYSNSIARTYPNISLNFLIYSLLMLSILCLTLLYLLVFTKFTQSITRFLLRPFSFSIQQKGEVVNEKIRDGMSVVKEKKKIIRALGLSYIMWGFYILTAYTVIMAYNLDMDFGLKASDALLISVVNMMGAYIFQTPGSIGISHASVKFLLVNLWNIDTNIAVTYATVRHGIGYFLSIIIGFICFLLERKSILTKRD